jgi:hypothetical protein
MNNIVTTSPNTNVIVVTSPGPSGQKGDRGDRGLPGTINSNSGLNITGSSIFSGSADGDPTLSVIGSAVITGSLTVSGSNTFINIGPAQFTGSTSILGTLAVNGIISGSGAGLTNIPASGIVGLNLNRIALGTVTASVSTGSTLFNVSSDNDSKFSINSAGQVNIPNILNVQGQTILGNTAIVGSATINNSPILTAATLASNRITDSNISASVSSTGKAFNVTNGPTSLMSVDQQGAISGSGLYVSGSAIYVNGPTIRLYGNATLNDAAITTTATTTTDRIQSGTVTASVATLGNAFTLQDSGNTLFTISTTGILSGSGAKLYNIPASGIVGLNLSQIASGSVSASISPDRGFIVNANSEITGTLIVTQGITSSFSGSFQGDGSGLVIPASSITGLNLSQVATGSVSASVNVGNTNFQVISGSTSLMSLDSTGKLFLSRSVNIGTPPGINKWESNLQGSYFNNFKSTDDASEILRFIAGLLSASAPDAAPNTREFGSTTANESNNLSTGNPSGYVPQSTTKSQIIYLTSKGFASSGNLLYSGKTIYYQNGYALSFESNPTSTTTVSSSNNPELFNLGRLSSGNATQVNVSGSINWFYSDNNSETVTEVSSSQRLISNNSFGTSNGITIGRINTANISVIPPAFQDGFFSGIFSSGLYNGGRNLLNVSASGWYHISSSISISSGSSPYTVPKTTSTRIFYAPVTEVVTAIGTNTLGVGYSGYTYLTATSRSLSGAPYLTAATWAVSSSVTGLFNPLYGNSTTLSRILTDGNVSIANPGIGTYTVSVTSGQINTGNAVYDSTGVTARNTSTVPFETDIIRLTGSISLSIGTGTNIAQASVTPTTFTAVTYGRNKDATESSLNTLTIPYHTAGTFGQPASSGSLAYFGGGSTNTTLIEYFTSESFRRQISNSTTLTTQWNQESRLSFGNSGPLQVKPGFLVNPESSNGYWYPTSGYDGTHYKWYMREFNTGAAKTSLTITLSPATSADLVDFQNTNANKIAIGLIFEYQVNNKGASRVVMFDVIKGNGTYGGALNNLSTSAQYNPFSDNIDIVGDFDSISNLAGTITVGFTPGINQIINSSTTKIWLVIRYRGIPSNPLQRITIS